MADEQLVFMPTNGARPAAGGGGHFQEEPEVEAAHLDIGRGLPGRRRPPRGGLLVAREQTLAKAERPAVLALDRLRPN